MKKIFISLAVAALTLVVSCKDPAPEPPIVDDPTGVSVQEEGVYQPATKIASISENGTVEEQWSWSGSNLDHIDMLGTPTSTLSFNYSGDYVAKVTSNDEDAEEIRYTYANNKFQGCEIYEGGVLGASMNFLHNAAGKISSADISINDSYLLGMFGDMSGEKFSSPIEKMVGRNAIKLMAQMAKFQNLDQSKFEITNKSFTLSFRWNGDNVEEMVMNGNVTVGITTEDLELLETIGIEIPAEYMSIINLAIMAGGGTLPVQMTISDTVTNTYDNKTNPFYCYWGDGITPEALSKNNVLSTMDRGAIKVTVAAMGQTIPLMDESTGLSEEIYTYEYNSNGFPTAVISGGERTTYSYK